MKTVFSCCRITAITDLSWCKINIKYFWKVLLRVKNQIVLPGLTHGHASTNFCQRCHGNGHGEGHGAAHREVHGDRMEESDRQAGKEFSPWNLCHPISADTAESQLTSPNLGQKLIWHMNFLGNCWADVSIRCHTSDFNIHQFSILLIREAR